MKQEGEYWDFKRQWYSKKEDMLHDIICMANNLTINDGYIIIGVDEENDYLICDVANDSNRRKTQDIVTFLRDKNFAGDIRPTVYIETLSVKDKLIDVIVVQNDRNTPYYLTKPHGKEYICSKCNRKNYRKNMITFQNNCKMQMQVAYCKKE